MTNQHPITPPPELVQQWVEEADTFRFLVKQVHQYVADCAAQWGADQELEACIGLLVQQGFDFVDELRAARRPKPPSLKEQALEQLDGIAIAFRVTHGGNLVCDKILAALEALDD